MPSYSSKYSEIHGSQMQSPSRGGSCWGNSHTNWGMEVSRCLGLKEYHYFRSTEHWEGGYLGRKVETFGLMAGYHILKEWNGVPIPHGENANEVYAQLEEMAIALTDDLPRTQRELGLWIEQAWNLPKYEGWGVNLESPARFVYRWLPGWKGAWDLDGHLFLTLEGEEIQIPLDEIRWGGLPSLLKEWEKGFYCLGREELIDSIALWLIKSNPWEENEEGHAIFRFHTKSEDFDPPATITIQWMESPFTGADWLSSRYSWERLLVKSGSVSFEGEDYVIPLEDLAPFIRDIGRVECRVDGEFQWFFVGWESLFSEWDMPFGVRDKLNEAISAKLSIDFPD